MPNRSFWLLAAGIAGLLNGPMALSQDVLFQRSGMAGENYGRVIRAAGDVNGDGIGDVIVGAAGCPLSGAGFAELLSGADGSVIRKLTSAQHSLLGTSVDGVGDINGDGFDDVIVGAPATTVTGSAAIVYSGSNGSELLKWTGSAFVNMGRAVTGMGDLNGDTTPDIAVGRSDGSSGEFPQVDFYSGTDGTMIDSIKGGTPFFAAIQFAAVGDIDADQVCDFLVILDDQSTVEVRSGANRSIIRKHPALVFGGGSEPIGKLIDGTGDVDGDGVPDYVISGRPNRATVYSGAAGSVIHTFQGSGAKNFGYSVSGADDANGDGRADILVAWHDSSGAQFVTLFSGSTGAELYRFGDPEAGSLFGIGMAALGDLNGDGLSDFALGSASSLICGADAGRIDVHAGNDLFLNISPDAVQTGTLVTETIREGVPGSSVMLALTKVNSLPVFIIIDLQVFDGTGTYQQSQIVPPVAGGVSLTLTGFALDASATVITTGEEVLLIK